MYTKFGGTGVTLFLEDSEIIMEIGFLREIKIFIGHSLCCG